VVEDLAYHIIGGNLPPGAALPTEGALCDEFGFSRTVMREGLKLLEERGLIRVEQGRGTTVQPRDSWNLLDPTVLRIALDHDVDTTLLDDLITVRRLLEAHMARAAASRLSDADLAGLAEDVERMPLAIEDYAEFQRLDREFHAKLMRASGSEVGRTIVGAIHQHAGRNPRLGPPPPGSRASLARTAEAHRAIFDALMARDGDLAAERIAEHIDSAWAERRITRADR
jgi:GntR family transcriptional regulator, galactonate operon transcriptional repressor